MHEGDGVDGGGEFGGRSEVVDVFEGEPSLLVSVPIDSAGVLKCNSTYFKGFAKNNRLNNVETKRTHHEKLA